MQNPILKITIQLQQWENEIQQCIDWLCKTFDINESVGNPDKTKGPEIPRNMLS